MHTNPALFEAPLTPKRHWQSQSLPERAKHTGHAGYGYLNISIEIVINVTIRPFPNPFPACGT